MAIPTLEYIISLGDDPRLRPLDTTNPQPFDNIKEILAYDIHTITREANSKIGGSLKVYMYYNRIAIDNSLGLSLRSTRRTIV